MLTILAKFTAFWSREYSDTYSTLDVGLTCSKQSDDDLNEYSDSDFAGLKDKRHSIGRYVFILVGEVITHSSKQQSIITLSSCEAEYMAFSEAAKEAIWAGRFLHELGFQDDQPILIYTDNKEAIDLTTNSLLHKKTKHIEIRWHWIREVVEKGKITIHYLPTKEMLADGLTNPFLPPLLPNFERC